MATTKEKQLRKHKLIASGLFFLMVIVYASMVWLDSHHPQNWIGYVKAFSEAGMVGALADWFAVTALFRHPLGIPIPHTNLITRKQKDLGENLGKFVKENFLNSNNIRPYIGKLDVVKFAANWLNKTENQKILEQEIVELFKKIIHDMDDEEVKRFLNQKLNELISTADLPQLASKAVHYLIEKDEHNRLLDRILPQLKEYVNESSDLIRERISENRPFIAFLAGRKISRELTDGLSAFIQEIIEDENHFVRRKLTEGLNEFANDLPTSEAWQKKFENLKGDIIQTEKLKPFVNDLWASVKKMMTENLEDPDSVLNAYLKKNIQKLSENLANDKELGERLNKWIRHFVYRMILRNSDEAEKLISSTVSGWDGKELSRKLELEVGKDLQYIRVNGTLVGGLVGLIIYTLTQFFTS